MHILPEFLKPQCSEYNINCGFVRCIPWPRNLKINSKRNSKGYLAKTLKYIVSTNKLNKYQKFLKKLYKIVANRYILQ